TFATRGTPSAQQPAYLPILETGDACPRAFADLSQHGSGDATLAIPADEVSLSEAPPQAAEQRSGERGVDASARPGLTLEIDQDQQERTTRAGGTLLLQRQEVSEGAFVIGSALTILHRHPARASIGLSLHTQHRSRGLPRASRPGRAGS